MSQGSRAFKTLLFANRCGCGMLFIPKYRWSLMYAVRCTQTWRFGPNQGVSCSQSPESKRKSTGNHSRIEASCKILTVTIYILTYIHVCINIIYICILYIYIYVYIYNYSDNCIMMHNVSYQFISYVYHYHQLVFGTSWGQELSSHRRHTLGSRPHTRRRLWKHPGHQKISEDLSLSIPIHEYPWIVLDDLGCNIP